MAIERLQCFERGAPIAELADVVVFYDPGIGPRCPIQQRQTPLERHDDPRRKLMAGRDIERRARSPEAGSLAVSSPCASVGMRMRRAPIASNVSVAPG